MTLDEFQNFINQQDALFRSIKTASESERERILAIGDQRSGKMEGRSMESLAGEFADVVITTFLLAKAMGVDIPAALDRKIKEIREKHNKQLR